MTSPQSHPVVRALRRRWVLLGLAGWTALVVLFSVLDRPEAGTVVVLLALGPLFVGLARAHRQNLRTLRRLEKRAAQLDKMQGSAAEAVRDLTALRASLDTLADKSVSADELNKALRDTAADVITRTRKGVAVDLLLTYRQIEALNNLYATAGVDRPMPQTRGWASSPDLLLFLAKLVELGRPSLIVECGSGTSTLWLAMVLRRFEIKGRIVALEHLQEYVDGSRGLVERHGLGDVVDVRYAPLESIQVGGEPFRWYARDAWDDLDQIDLLFVDGPPAEVGVHARLPAFPLLVGRLHAEGVVVLDDLIRTDEQEVLAEWVAAFPDYTAETVRLEKNAAVLRRHASGVGRSPVAEVQPPGLEP